MFSDLNKLESELMDMLNDHIRLVQFGYDGDLENIYSLLRLVCAVMADDKLYRCVLCMALLLAKHVDYKTP